MSRSEDEQKLAAAQLLLRDVRDQRSALDRREADLEELVAQLEARIAGKRSQGPRSGSPPQQPTLSGIDEDQAVDDPEQTSGGTEYGAIINTVFQIFRDNPKRMNAQQVADILENRKVPIRAQTYYKAARGSIRRLHQTGRLKRVGPGFYRPDKSIEAQAGARASISL